MHFNKAIFKQKMTDFMSNINSDSNDEDILDDLESLKSYIEDEISNIEGIINQDEKDELAFDETDLDEDEDE